MADKRYISLKVCGNPSSNSGFMPIALFNSPTFDIADNVPGGFADNPYFFSVSIAHAQTIYKLYKNNVRSFGAMRAGRLIIAISIPQGFRLANDMSPMDVLLKLKDAFISTSMTTVNATSDAHEFNQTINADEALSSIAMQYPLEMVPGVHRTMTEQGPKAYFLATGELTRQFMKDVQYDEFRGYSEVVVAEKASPDTDCTLIDNLQIPRPKNYRVIMDGQVRGIVSNLQQVITCSSNKSEQYYENSSVNFTIAQLLSGETFNGVTLDAINECVIIQGDKLAKAKTLQMAIAFNNQEHGQYFASNIDLLTLKVGNVVKTISPDLTFELVGDEIALQTNPTNFSMLCKETSTVRIVSMSVVGNMLALDTAMRVIKPVTPAAPKEKMVDVLFSFTDRKKFPGGAKHLNITLKGKDKNAAPVFQQTVEFNQEWNNGGTVYQGRMQLPKNKCYGFNYASFTVGKDKYTSLHALPVGTDSIVLRDQDFANNSKAKNIKIILIVSAIAIVTFLAGIVIYYNFFKKDEVTEEKIDVTEQVAEQPVQLNEEQVKSILESIPKGWDNDTLTIAHVKRVHKMYLNNESLFLQVDKQVFGDKNMCQVIIDYDKLINFIEETKTPKLKAKYKNMRLYNRHMSHLEELYNTPIEDNKVENGMRFVAGNSKIKTVADMLQQMKLKAFGESNEEGMSEEISEPQDNGNAREQTKAKAKDANKADNGLKAKENKPSPTPQKKQDALNPLSNRE